MIPDNPTEAQAKQAVVEHCHNYRAVAEFLMGMVLTRLADLSAEDVEFHTERLTEWVRGVHTGVFYQYWGQMFLVTAERCDGMLRVKLKIVTDSPVGSGVIDCYEFPEELIVI